MLLAMSVMVYVVGQPDPASAQGRTQPQPSGQQLAQKYCAPCHVVVPDGKRGWTDAPSFESIAQRDGMSVGRLTSIMRQPHPKMMNIERPSVEADAIARYIMSLRGR